jgi:radical SAM family uncharacterized protein
LGFIESFGQRLASIRKPAAYTGGEYGAVMKDLADVRLSVAFCFPDTYDIGMSHLGLQILYGLINSLPHVWCERAFAPRPDMEELLRQSDTPLPSLESGRALRDFDVIAFTLQYELCYTNVLNMLDLGGVPIHARARSGLSPLVIAGGPCALNPEPLTDFIDAFVVGDGEEVTLELMGLLLEAKAQGSDKQTLLRSLSRVEGIYVPASVGDGGPAPVRRRVVADLDTAYFPTRPVVPNTEVVHERVMLELFRGCRRGCRFCQAGWANRPVRAASPATLLTRAKAACEHTGYDEIALTSLSSSDYPHISRLCAELLEYTVPRRVNLSLPSLRADSFSSELSEQTLKVRKSGLTFAPEAGTQRLRDVINKNLTEDELLSACQAAFAGGHGGVKLYFMLGLPTETDEDVSAIAALARKVISRHRSAKGGKAAPPRVSLSVSCFVPKPHTPFQWAEMIHPAEMARRAELLRAQCPRAVTLRWHDPLTSYWEAVLARGGGETGKALEAAWRAGARLDAWSEHFKPRLWQEAFASQGIDPSDYALRARSADEALPWAHIRAGVRARHLWQEYQRALAGVTTPDCAEACSGCGACEGGGKGHES